MYFQVNLKVGNEAKTQNIWEEGGSKTSPNWLTPSIFKQKIMNVGRGCGKQKFRIKYKVKMKDS